MLALQVASAFRKAGLPLASLEVLAQADFPTPADELRRCLAVAAAWRQLHRPDGALAELEQARQLDSPALPAELRCALQTALAAVYYQTGRFDLGLDAANAALDLTPEDAPGHLTLLLDVCDLHIARGEWLPAEAVARRVRQSSGAGCTAARALHALGVIAAETDRLCAARQHLEAACQAHAAAGDEGWLARSRTELARVYVRLSDPAEALRHGGLALAAFWSLAGTLDKAELARLSRLFGALFRAAGDRSQAVACLNRAAAYYAQTGFLSDWQRVSEELAELLAEGEAPPAPGSRGFPVPARDRARVAYLMALLNLADSLSSIHPHLESHAEVVTAYALSLGRHLGLASEDLDALGHAGRLHDVGLTLGDVGDAVAQHLHPKAGEELLRTFPLPRGCLSAVRHHHERWDGAGFPDGLAGEAIPLPARILAVTDAYVTLTCAAPPAPRRSHSQALDALRSDAGSAFDPAVVAAFERLHAEAASLHPHG